MVGLLAVWLACAITILGLGLSAEQQRLRLFIHWDLNYDVEAILVA